MATGLWHQAGLRNFWLHFSLPTNHLFSLPTTHHCSLPGIHFWGLKTTHLFSIPTTHLWNLPTIHLHSLPHKSSLTYDNLNNVFTLRVSGWLYLKIDCDQSPDVVYSVSGDYKLEGKTDTRKHISVFISMDLTSKKWDLDLHSYETRWCHYLLLHYCSVTVELTWETMACLWVNYCLFVRQRLLWSFFWYF